jgi:hypothetical protein
MASNAGTWNDHFSQPILAGEWSGERDAFKIEGGVLEGESAWPVGGSPLNVIAVRAESTSCDVACWVNVVSPNFRICTKGALILRYTGTNGYVFALHEPTQTIEVYRLSTHEMLLKTAAKIELKKWYYLRASLRGAEMKFFVDGALIGTVTDTLHETGTAGVGVQDAEAAWFDDFTLTGSDIVGNADGVDRPELTVVGFGQEYVVLRFLATPPYDYFVQASSNPQSHDWQTIANFRAKLDAFEAEVAEAVTNALRFYRVEKVPCNCR